MDDLDHSLAGRNALEHVTADGLLFDRRHELARDLEVDVGFEQGQAHLAKRGVHVLFGDAALVAELGENAGELIGEVVEHPSQGTRWQEVGQGGRHPTKRPRTMIQVQPDRPSTEPRSRTRWRMLALNALSYGCFGLAVGSLPPLVDPIIDDLEMTSGQMGLVLGTWQLVFIGTASPWGP